MAKERRDNRQFAADSLKESLGKVFKSHQGFDSLRTIAEKIIETIPSDDLNKKELSDMSNEELLKFKTQVSSTLKKIDAEMTKRLTSTKVEVEPKASTPAKQDTEKKNVEEKK